MDVERTVSTHTNLVSPGGSDTTPFAFGSTVGRFLIRDRLGAGGMGEVYRAEDTQLKRTVAIKRLVHAAADPNPTARLLKEAQRASALNHPRIASVYDVVTMGDELLLVMEYVDGVTLRERMKRPLAVTDFYGIAVQCTDALAAAHANGILHGDLKPANIMLTRDGQVKVCDFGLARRLPTSDGAGETTTTSVHGIAGTPAYLAPEAVLNHPLDERADIFSLGVVFYQMLAERNPFSADGLMATLDRVLHVSPEPLDQVNRSVPTRLARTVHRMLEKEPRDRFASAAAVGDAISSIGAHHVQIERRQRLVRRARLWAAGAAAALLALFMVPRLANPPAAPTAVALPERIHLAVLPFIVTGADASQDTESFREGLTDVLNAQLVRLTLDDRFQVVTEADRRRRSVTDPVTAREQFGANLALRGQLLYAGNAVEVFTELLDTRSGKPLRSGERFTVSGGDAVAIRSRIFETVVKMIGLTLDEKEKLLLNAQNIQPTAYDFYVQARGYLLDYDRLERVNAAIDVFRKALEHDSKYALAYAGLGEALWRKYNLTKDTTLVDAAQANCEGARGQDSNLAEPHVCLGMVLNGRGQYELAAGEYDWALKLEPTNDLAIVGLADAYVNLRQPIEAENTYLRAIDLRKHYWGGYNNLGVFYLNASRFDDALKRFQQVIDLAPDSIRGYNAAGVAAFKLNRIDEAIAVFTKSMSIRPNITAASNLATAYYFQGKYPLAEESFREALKVDQGRYELWANFARTLEFLGKQGESNTAYQKARELATELVKVNRRNAAVWTDLADHHAALDDIGNARRALAEAEKLAPVESQTLFRIAVVYEGRLNDRENALRWLTRAIEHGQTWLEIENAPELKRLRDDPRYQQLRNSH